MKRSFHPVLFAVLPVLSQLGTNVESVGLRFAIRPLAVLLLIALSLWYVLYRAYRSWEQAAVVTSISISVISVYGYVHTLVINLLPSWGENPVVAHAVLSVCAVGLLLLVAWLVRREPASATRLNSTMNLVVAAALIYPVVKIVDHELRGVRSWPSGAGPLPAAQPIQAARRPEHLPDIYYIVLDGYGRADVLRDLYGYDNQPFLDFLEQSGFFVAEQSRSNYGVTHLSLAASLNMQYLDDLAIAMGPESADHRPVAQLVTNSRVVASLSDLGYRTVAGETGYRRTEMRGVDFFIRQPRNAVNPFEALLIEESMLRSPLDVAAELGVARWYPGYRSHEQLIRLWLEQLTEMASMPSPKFVFVHIFAPHPPFVFDAVGRSRPQHSGFSTHDGSRFPGTAEEYREGYVGQITYLNQRLREVVQVLLSDSAVRPIVVLQGDHGPGMMTNWEVPAETDLRERMGIMNAILPPAGVQTALYDDMTPVNTFRVVLDALFDTGTGPLPDRSYFSSWRWPYDFIPYEPSDSVVERRLPPR